MSCKNKTKKKVDETERKMDGNQYTFPFDISIPTVAPKIEDEFKDLLQRLPQEKHSDYTRSVVALQLGSTSEEIAKLADVDSRTLDYVRGLEVAPVALKRMLALGQVTIFDAWAAVKAMNDTRADCFDSDGNPIEEYRDSYGGKTLDELWAEVLSKFQSGNAHSLYLAVAEICSFDPDPPKKALDADLYYRELYNELIEEARDLGIEYQSLPDDASTDEYMSEVEPVVLGPELRKKIKAAYRKKRAEAKKAERVAQAVQDKEYEICSQQLRV